MSNSNKLKSVNLQNFPKHGAGYEVRNIITAPENHVIVSLDYAQLEARLLAMASKDEVFCKAIWDGEDTHMRWAERILEDCPDLLEKYNITKKEFRSDVKTNLVFASFYGSSRDSVAYHYQTNYGISQNITFSIFEEFWNIYSDVKKWQQSQIDFYDRHGYIESLTGRRRHAPLNINKIINLSIQSTASYDICLGAGDRLSELAYKLNKPQYQYIINVHDSLDFYVPVESVEEDILFIAKEMVRPMFDWVIVPLEVECSIGTRWAEMEEIGKWDSRHFGFM